MVSLIKGALEAVIGVDCAPRINRFISTDNFHKCKRSIQTGENSDVISNIPRLEIYDPGEMHDTTVNGSKITNLPPLNVPLSQRC